MKVYQGDDNTEYNTLDFLKFIMAIFIIGIHSKLLHVDSSFLAWTISSCIFRLGVPFFFVVSGYFLADKLYRINKNDRIENRSVIGAYCKKMIPPLALWGGIGLLLNALSQFRAGKSWLYMFAYACRTFFYPLSAMWYLWASIIGAMILGFLYLRFNHWKVVWIVYSIVAYCIVLVCNNYYFLMQGTFFQSLIETYMKIFVSARNGVFLAPVFLGMGFVLRDDKVKNWFCDHKNIPIVTTIIGFGLLFLESSLLYRLPSLDDRGYFISLLLIVPSIVCLGLLYSMKINLPYRLMRRLSTSLFFVHATIISIIRMFLGDEVNTVLLFLATVLIAFIVSFISYHFKRKTVALLFG